MRPSKYCAASDTLKDTYRKNRINLSSNPSVPRNMFTKKLITTQVRKGKMHVLNLLTQSFPELKALINANNKKPSTKAKRQVKVWYVLEIPYSSNNVEKTASIV